MCKQLEYVERHGDWLYQVDRDGELRLIAWADETDRLAFPDQQAQAPAQE